MSGIINSESQFHLKIKSGDVGRYVILPGDPQRVPLIAEHLENAKQISYNREYNIYTGYLNKTKVSVCSTGIGGPSAAIAVEELVRCGADTFIRVGTSGGMDLSVSGGDLVIAETAVRSEGTSHEYLPENYPAAADFTVTQALYSSARSLSSDEDGKRCHVGTVHSKDSFYGEVEPDSMPVGSQLEKNWRAYLKCGCLASEMECAAIFSVAAARQVRAGAVLTAIWNVERSNSGLEDKTTYDSSRAIKCAVEAIKLLIERDG